FSIVRCMWSTQIGISRCTEWKHCIGQAVLVAALGHCEQKFECIGMQVYMLAECNNSNKLLSSLCLNQIDLINDQSHRWLTDWHCQFGKLAEVSKRVERMAQE